MNSVTKHSLRFAMLALILFGLNGTSISISATRKAPQHKSQTVDFDGDGFTDVVLFDTSLARWFSYDFFSGELDQFDIGFPGVTQVVGDYDGDGMSDFAYCYNNLTSNLKMWHISYSTYGPKGNIAWGTPGDIPVPADYDGDGRTDIAIYRPFGGVWYIRLSRDRSIRTEHVGNPTDILVPADYDGDGLTDIAVMRPTMNEWYIHFSSNDSFQAIEWNIKSETGDVFVPADYDGDGIADFAVYRRRGGLWSILESRFGAYRLAQFGNGVYTGAPSQADVTDSNYDLPMPGDFDGDGIIDIAIWNAKSKIVRVLPSSSSILRSVPVGSSGSLPVSLSVLAEYQNLNSLNY